MGAVARTVLPEADGGTGRLVVYFDHDSRLNVARLEQLYAVPGIKPRLETRLGQRASLVTRTTIDTHPHEPLTPYSTPARL